MASEEDPFGLILKAAQLLHQRDDSHLQGLVQNDSECETDSEEDMVEIESEVTQTSLPGTFEQPEGHGSNEARRKEERGSNLLTEQTSWRARSEEEEELELSPDPSNPRQEANDKHNMKERLRRKDLKQAVLRLRSQLRKKTKKPSTITVLKAAQEEIRELKSLALKRDGELDAEKERHAFLTWRLERLKSEYSDPSRQRGIKQPMPAPQVPIPLPPCASPATAVPFFSQHHLPPQGHPGHVSPLVLLSPTGHHASIDGSPVLPPRFAPLSAPGLPPSPAAFCFSPPHMPGYPPSSQIYPVPSPHLHSHHHPVPHHSPYILPYPMMPHGHTTLSSFLPSHTGMFPFTPNYPLHLMPSVRPLPVPYSVAREISSSSSSSSVETERWSILSYGSARASTDATTSSFHPSNNLSDKEIRPDDGSRFTSIIRSSLPHSSAATPSSVSSETPHTFADISSVTEEDEEEEEEIEVDIIRSPKETERDACGPPGSPQRPPQDVLQSSEHTSSIDCSNSRYQSGSQSSTDKTPVSKSGPDPASSHPSDSTFHLGFQQHAQQQHECPKNFLDPPALKRAGVHFDDAAVVSKIIEHVRPQRELLGKAAVEHALGKYRGTRERCACAFCGEKCRGKRKQHCLARKKKVEKSALAHHITSVPLIGCS